MRLRIMLPKVTPEAIEVPTRRAYAGCRGRKLYLRQEVAKPLRDTVYQEVQVHRYQCLKCKRTFRVYPEGTTPAQTGASSQRTSRDAVFAGAKRLCVKCSEGTLQGHLAEHEQYRMQSLSQRIEMIFTLSL